MEDKGQTAVIVSVDMDRSCDQTERQVTKWSQDCCDCIEKDDWCESIITGNNLYTGQVVLLTFGLIPEILLQMFYQRKRPITTKCVWEAEEGAVAMVDTGVNDSPALAETDTFNSIGAGLNIAFETADLVLMNFKLTDVVSAVNLSQALSSPNWFNFVWALGYNIIAIPFAASVFYHVLLYPIFSYLAGVAVIMSSLTVLTSTLLLNLYWPPNYQQEYKRMRTEMWT